MSEGLGSYLSADVDSMAGGWLSSHFIGLGWIVNSARKTALLLAALRAVPMVTVAKVPSPLVTVLLIGLGTAAHQAFSSNIFTMIADMWPPGAVATNAGMGGAAGAVGGILITQATRWTLELIWSYVSIVLDAGLADLIALTVIQKLVPCTKAARV